MSTRLAWLVPFSMWLGCTASPEPLTLDVDRPDPVVAPEPGPETRLRLEISRRDPGPIELGQPVIVEAAIRNISARPQAIVLPGDGSISGMREPRISWAGEIDPGDGKYVPMGPARSIGGCGNYDDLWHDEIVTIPPGGVQWLPGWIGTPDELVAFERPGRARVMMRYAYTAGAGKRSFDAGEMGATPAFVLESNLLEVELGPPADAVR